MNITKTKTKLTQNNNQRTVLYQLITLSIVMINGMISLKEQKIKVNDAYVIVNRMEGADEALKTQGVTLHSITNVMQITQNLHEQNLVDDEILQKVQEQIKIK